MAIERTLGIIKPDAVAAGTAGKILAMYQEAGLKVVAMKMIYQTKSQAGGFYIVHKERPFYGELCDFMSSGPCIPVVLEGENAIEANRKLMGATNSKEAAKGTIRNLYGTNLQNNAVHGSDGPESAAFEIGYYFSALEIVG